MGKRKSMPMRGLAALVVLVSVAAFALRAAQAFGPTGGGKSLNAKLVRSGAQVGLRNCREKPMQYSAGYLYPGADAWITAGHFEVEPGSYRYYKFPPYTRRQSVYFRYYSEGDALGTAVDRATSLDTDPLCMSLGDFLTEEYDNGTIAVIQNTQGQTGSLGIEGCNTSNGLSLEEFYKISKDARDEDNKYLFRSGCT